jgi:hypothetical protein
MQTTVQDGWFFNLYVLTHSQTNTLPKLVACEEFKSIR